MSTITYACINEAHSKLVEYPARMGALGPIADSLQTVLTSVPLSESFDFKEVEDNDYYYYYSTPPKEQNHTSRFFIAGCACRKMPSHRNSANSNHNNLSQSEIRAFLKDALKLIPMDAAKVSVIDEAKLKEIQNLLKQRLEASTDKKLADVNAAIERARQTMEKNIEEALARDDHLRRMEENSSGLRDSAEELQRKSDQLSWKFFKERVRMAAIIAVILAVVALVIVAMVCKPNLSDCQSGSGGGDSAATAPPASPSPPSVVVISGSG